MLSVVVVELTYVGGEGGEWHLFRNAGRFMVLGGNAIGLGTEPLRNHEQPGKASGARSTRQNRS